MKRGFTLLELIIVIIIIGVLATLGFTQYGRMVERARGAEARAVLGDMRKLAFAYYVEHGNSLAGILTDTNNPLNLGTAEGQISSGCTTRHYFQYQGANIANNIRMDFIARRCIASGKTPNAPAANTLTLTSNFQTGNDVWTSTFGY